MNWFDDGYRIIDLTNPRETAEIASFLQMFGLSFDGAVEYTIGLYRSGALIGTGSFAGEVLRNIAVDERLQGEGLTAGIVSELIQELGRRGRFHYFIYTRPDKAWLFAGLGFTEVARAEPYAALLESGLGSVSEYCAELQKTVTARLPGFASLSRRAALVMNCNPFTLGHREIICQAARENDAVIVFIVTEDRSLFPFEHRIRLVSQGVADLPNVVVVPGGKYIISAATFPGYFTKGEETVIAQTCLDVTLFARHIAPKLGITARYAGQEPYCPVTAQYNQAMSEILPRYGIDVRILPRFAVNGGIISASKVREALRQADWDTVRQAVPATTFQYLQSEEAAPVLAKLKYSQSRH